jgi:hypothetical protein
MTQWHSGPPPSLGWWPTKVDGWLDNGHLRWWDGAGWSEGVFSNDTLKRVARCALYRTAVNPEYIYWSARPDSWPERSRT